MWKETRKEDSSMLDLQWVRPFTSISGRCNKLCLCYMYPYKGGLLSTEMKSFLIPWHFKKTLFFSAMLGSQQYWAEGTDFPIFPHLHTCIASPMSASPWRVVHLLQYMNPCWRIIIIQSPWLTSGLTLGCVYSVACPNASWHPFASVESHTVVSPSWKSCVRLLLPHPYPHPQLG